MGTHGSNSTVPGVLSRVTSALTRGYQKLVSSQDHFALAARMGFQVQNRSLIMKQIEGGVERFLHTAPVEILAKTLDGCDFQEDTFVSLRVKYADSGFRDKTVALATLGLKEGDITRECHTPFGDTVTSPIAFKMHRSGALQVYIGREVFNDSVLLDFGLSTSGEPGVAYVLPKSKGYFIRYRSQGIGWSYFLFKDAEAAQRYLNTMTEGGRMREELRTRFRDRSGDGALWGRILDRFIRMDGEKGLIAQFGKDAFYGALYQFAVEKGDPHPPAYGENALAFFPTAEPQVLRVSGLSIKHNEPDAVIQALTNKRLSVRNIEISQEMAPFDSNRTMFPGSEKLRFTAEIALP